MTEWADVGEYMDVDVAYNLFQNKMKNLLNTIFKTNRINNKTDTSWVTVEI